MRIKKAALFLFFNSRVVVPHLGRWAQVPSSRIKNKMRHVALEPAPAPHVAFCFFEFIRGVRFFILNSSFAGKVVLELGPAPHVATFFICGWGTWGGRFVWHPKDTKSGPHVNFRSISERFVVEFWSISDRFPIDFRSISYQFLINFRSISDRFPVDFLSISDRFSDDFL